MYVSRSATLAVATTNAHMVFFLGIAALGVPGSGREARAQDMEPRAYSASPIDANFLLASYLRTTGAVSLDPALPISNIKGSINTGIAFYPAVSVVRPIEPAESPPRI
jgi:hypothetical protein